jgi:hypothetical protein
MKVCRFACFSFSSPSHHRSRQRLDLLRLHRHPLNGTDIIFGCVPKKSFGICYPFVKMCCPLAEVVLRCTQEIIGH